MITPPRIVHAFWSNAGGLQGRLSVGPGQHQMTRSEALAAGATTYAGNPCRYGHDGARYAKTGACVACMAKHNKARWVADPRAQNIKVAEWRKANKARHNATHARWRANNIEKIRARARDQARVRRARLKAAAAATKE